MIGAVMASCPDKPTSQTENIVHVVCKRDKWAHTKSSRLDTIGSIGPCLFPLYIPGKIV